MRALVLAFFLIAGVLDVDDWLQSLLDAFQTVDTTALNGADALAGPIFDTATSPLPSTWDFSGVAPTDWGNIWVTDTSNPGSGPITLQAAAALDPQGAQEFAQQARVDSLLATLGPHPLSGAPSPSIEELLMRPNQGTPISLGVSGIDNQPLSPKEMFFDRQGNVRVGSPTEALAASAFHIVDARGNPIVGPNASATFGPRISAALQGLPSGASLGLGVAPRTGGFGGGGGVNISNFRLPSPAAAQIGMSPEMPPIAAQEPLPFQPYQMALGGSPSQPSSANDPMANLAALFPETRRALTPAIFGGMA